MMITVSKSHWDVLEGREVSRYTLKNEKGMEVTVTDYGCTVLSILTPDREGKPCQRILGYDSLEGYRKNSGYFGAAIGRVGNRIGGASFELNGKRYDLFANNGANSLHGGKVGFNARIWEGTVLSDGVQFAYFSPDGEENYPGNLNVTVTYRLTEDNALSMEYHAVSDADTILNLTNHTYFNLNGGEKDILDHQLTLASSAITPVDAALIPDGSFMPVEGTPFDFRTPHAIGERIRDEHPQLAFGGGYDHNFVLDLKDSMGYAAKVTANGCEMTVYTDMPGVQLYTGNMIATIPGTGRNGCTYYKNYALCLETQNYPDAIHHAEFPSPVLKAGESYNTKTVYRFA